MKLSIIVPTIRLDKWDQLFNSVLKSCVEHEFEIIFVGPEPNINCEAWKDSRVKYIRDYRQPNATQNIALQYATGDIVLAAADDCIFHEYMIDKCLNILEENWFDEKTILITKYTEAIPNLQNDDYYVLNKAFPPAKYIQDNWWIFNCAFINRRYLEELGGWDPRFQVPCFGFADLAARAQKDDVNIFFLKEALLHCEHGQPDHRPIEQAHVFEDAPLYQHLHNTEPDRIQIELDSWKSINPVWNKRYAM